MIPLRLPQLDLWGARARTSAILARHGTDRDVLLLLTSLQSIWSGHAGCLDYGERVHLSPCQLSALPLSET
jgi:hypothetical protein